MWLTLIPLPSRGLAVSCDRAVYYLYHFNSNSATRRVQGIGIASATVSTPNMPCIANTRSKRNGVDAAFLRAAPSNTTPRAGRLRRLALRAFAAVQARPCPPHLHCGRARSGAGRCRFRPRLVPEQHCDLLERPALRLGEQTSGPEPAPEPEPAPAPAPASISCNQKTRERSRKVCCVTCG